MSNVTRRVRTACITMLAMSLVACSVSRMSRGTVTAQQRSEISSSDIKQLREGVDNAYDIVRTLRPWMLVMRDRAQLLLTTSATSPNDSRGIRVYIDDISVGGIEMLRTIPRGAIVHVQWLSAIDATTRYGSGRPSGVIAVTTGASPR